MTANVTQENQALRTLKIIVFTVVGVALMVGAVWRASATRRFVARAASAAGEVTKLNAGGSHPEVRFTTAAGQVIEYPQGGMISGYRVGDRVEVLYEPESPRSSAVLNRPGALWGFTLTTFLMGAVFVLLPQLARRWPEWIG